MKVFELHRKLEKLIKLGYDNSEVLLPEECYYTDLDGVTLVQDKHTSYIVLESPDCVFIGSLDLNKEAATKMEIGGEG